MKNLNNLLNVIENMTLLDLNNFINLLKSRYNFANDNISSNSGSKNIDKEKVLKKKYSLYLINFGKSKISIIKLIKDSNNLGLKEAKDLVESCPVIIKNSFDYKSISLFKEKLEELGASVEIKEEDVE